MVPRKKELRELVAEAANDCGVPKTVAEMVGWIFRCAFRFYDEPILRVLQDDAAERKKAGIPSRAVVLTKESLYDISKRTGRNIYSIKRSIKRLCSMGKANYSVVD